MAPNEERLNLLWAANRTLQQVSLTWLTARGLVAEIEERRALDDGERQGAPGLFERLERIRENVNDAMSFGSDLRGPLSDEDFAWAINGIENTATAIEFETRHLAQLLLGVNAVHADTGWTEVADRAASELLSDADEEGVTLLDEDFRFSASSLMEARTELAGLICRMILEQSWILTVEVDSVPVRVAFLDHLLALWREDGVPHVWNDPVVVTEVVDEILGTTQTQISVSITPVSAASDGED
jgi:hypothetical protein